MKVIVVSRVYGPYKDLTLARTNRSISPDVLRNIELLRT